MKTTALLRAGIVLTCSTAITRTSPDSSRCTSDRFWIPHLAKNGWQPFFAGRICQHCFVIAYISKTTQGISWCLCWHVGIGRVIGLKIGVELTWGMVLSAKGSFRQAAWPSSQTRRGYPCRHLPERIVRQVCEGGHTCEPIWSGPNYLTLLGLVKIVKTRPNSYSMRKWFFVQ